MELPAWDCPELDMVGNSGIMYLFGELNLLLLGTWRT